MRRIRLYAPFTAALGLVGCASSPYEYVKLTGENILVSETGRPRVGYWPFSLDRIPLRYALTEPGVSLTIAVGEDNGAPNLEIVSSVPIRGVSIRNGYVYPVSSFKYIVSWGISEAPRKVDVIQISIDLDDRTEPILISGVIANGGKIFDCACGL